MLFAWAETSPGLRPVHHRHELQSQEQYLPLHSLGWLAQELAGGRKIGKRSLPFIDGIIHSSNDFFLQVAERTPM